MEIPSLCRCLPGVLLASGLQLWTTSFQLIISIRSMTLFTLSGVPRGPEACFPRLLPSCCALTLCSLLSPSQQSIRMSCQFCSPDVSQPVHCCLSPWPLPLLNPPCLSWMTAVGLPASLHAPTNPCSPPNLIRLLVLQFPARDRIRSKLCLFMAVRGLHCCVPASSSCDKLGLLFTVGHRPLIAVASLVSEHGCRRTGFSSCSTWAP